MKCLFRLLPALMLAASFPFNTSAQTQKADTLYAHFLQPGNIAQPRVWWHWMNGNITKTGIRKDLEWMHRSGIGGFQNFDASMLTPQVVEKRLVYMTPEWKDAFRFTTKLADSLRLEMAIAGSPGWSETGGPWVEPKDGMKKLVWKELRVKPGTTEIQLPAPPGTTGPFQNIPKQPEFGGESDPSKLPVFYRDIGVLAFRVPENDQSLEELGATVTSSGGSFSLSQLTDGDLTNAIMLPADSSKGYAWIQFAFPSPQSIKAITMVGGGNPGVFSMGADPKDSRHLEVSDDGEHFRVVATIPPGAILQQTIAIPPTTARYFRVTVRNPPPQINAFAAMTGQDPGKPKAAPGTDIAEIVLYTSDRIHMFEEKVAFAPVGDLSAKADRVTNDLVQPADIIDLTAKLNGSSIQWTVPAGNWKIVRFGYSLMGIDNHPASPEATGPEVDKMDSAAIRRYFVNYLGQYASATGGLMGKKGGLRFMVTDSWEAGAQNWTDNLPAEFERRRGYSMIPWMPVFTGQTVKSTEATERFLFDFRHTLSDLVAEYHYDGLTKILAAYGMQRYSESHENGRALIADGMEVKRSAAIPMSAMWTPNIFINGNDQTYHIADIRESASVAHIYGQNIVAAESLTALGIGGSAWSYAPENLKPTADLELASGLNRFVIHTSVHQPVDDKIPGLGLGPFGQWFNRHETWAEQAKAWTGYLSRSSYLLQQGKFVADVLYYYGEDNNITSLFGKKLPSIPRGYNYDFINADALINKLTVKDGRLVIPGGGSYAVLVLDSNALRMSLPVLRKLHALAKAGATLAGIQPKYPAGLKDAVPEFDQLVKETWAGQSNNNTEAVLNKLASPDFSYDAASGATLLFVHRRLADREIYWVNNRNARKEQLKVNFRVTGKIPMLWHPETAAVERLSFVIANGVTSVDLPLEANDAVFVIFKEKATVNAYSIPARNEQLVASLDGPWKVRFQEKRGAPAETVFKSLSSFTDNSDPGIKYFSGTAVYQNNVSVSANEFAAGKEWWLDLGEVKNLAEVLVNGRSAGIVWKQPFRVNISGSLKSGDNTIEVRVTNLWVNRLIGDAQPGVTKKITYTTMPFYTASSKLLPAGLLGPVRLLSN